ncbi:pentapeptide repeat-containing protein [Thermoleptolyngbya sp.]
MAQTNLLELAKQGDPQAIATLMNRSLQPRGMTASVNRQGNCLYVTLQAEQVPNRQVLTAFVQNGISNLGVSSIRLVKISGQRFGMADPAWTQDLQIDTPDLGTLGLDDPEPADPNASLYDVDPSLDGLDDITPASNPVSDILSELTAPPPSLSFEPEDWSPEEPMLDFENEFASGDLPLLEDGFSPEAIAPDDIDSSTLSDDLLADLDLSPDMGSDLDSDLVADLGSNDLGLGGLGDLESSSPASDIDSDFSEFDLGSDSFNGDFSSTPSSEPGMREPSGEALLSDLDALESTQDWSLDEPDELLNDLGSLEDELAQMGDEFSEIDAVTGESSPSAALEPDEFDLPTNLSPDFSTDFSMEPLGDVEGFDIGLPDLGPSGSASDDSFDMTPEVVDFPLDDLEELSPSSADEPVSEPLSGLEDLDLGDSSPSTLDDAGFGGMGLGDAGLDNPAFGGTEFGGAEFSSPDFDDASLSDADLNFDSSSLDLLGESPASADLEGALADLEVMGEAAADPGQEEDDLGTIPGGIASQIGAGFETEAQFDDLLPDSSTTELNQSTDFTEPAPTPAPYVAEEISLDLDLDNIQLPPVTAEGGDDWDADLEFGNLTEEDLSNFTADPAEPAETAVEAAAELAALDQGSELVSGEFTSGDWETAAPTEEPSGFDETLELASSPVPLPADFAASAAAPISAPVGDAAPWLSELPSEFVIDVTLNDFLPESGGIGLLGSVGSGGPRAIAPASLELAQDLELETQDLYFESAADSITSESSPADASSDFDVDLGNVGDLDSSGLDNLDDLERPNNSGSPDSLLDADLFDETPDIPLSQLPTEIPPSEIREDEQAMPDFLDMPLSDLEFNEVAFNSPYDSSPDSFSADEFTLEDETAPTELMSASEETLPSELLVDDLDESGGFEMDNLGLGLNRLEREDFQPSAPEASSGDDFGLGGLEEFDLDAPAADWQNEPEPLPETSFGLDDEDETTILLDPSAYPEASFGAASPSPELDREEQDWLTSEVAASANPPGSPLSSAEEGWSYGIPPAPPPPEDTLAYPASAPPTPDQAAVEAGEREAEAATESMGGRATNLLYAVLLVLLTWILALIGRSLWTELTQPEPTPAPAVDESPQSQDLNPERSPFSTLS